MGGDGPIDVTKDKAGLTGSPQPTPMSVNLFAKYPIRIFGLGLAIGETFKYVFNPWVTKLCSSLACTYFLCHAAYRAYEARNESVMVTGMFDALIFDGLASALVPTFITYHASRITFACLQESATIPDIILTWGPTVVGLCMLSLSVEPVDTYVGDALNDTLRKMYF